MGKLICTVIINHKVNMKQTPENSNNSTSKNQASPNQASAIDVFMTFLKLGFTSFGGPVAHIGYFRKELLEKRGWVSESQFAQLLAICQFIPGPASSQMGFALGLLRSGWAGAFSAFIAFTLPSAIIMIAFAASLSVISGELGQAIIHGLKIVACAIVADAVIGMAKNLCTDVTRRLIAIASCGLVLFIDAAWGQLLTIVIAALVGMSFINAVDGEFKERLTVKYSSRLAWLLLIIFSVLLVLFSTVSIDNNWYQASKAFYQAGALVFGGGHVVLPLLQDSIVTNGWVSNHQFLAGYGAAQAIPGPMFTFAGYLGALLPFESASTANAVLALFFMFLPGFLLVLVALPFWQKIYKNKRMSAMVSGVNASVVGILAAALYDPVLTAGIVSIVDAGIAILGFVLLRWLALSPLWVVLWCVVASALTTLI
jgi:chromate transporter